LYKRKAKIWYSDAPN
jgi:hypothetical protein